MGLLAGCAMVPMAFALLVVIVVVLVQEPFALVGLLLSAWAVRSLWRAHRAMLRRREQWP